MPVSTAVRAIATMSARSVKSIRNPGHVERMREHAERVESEDPGKSPVLCWCCGDVLGGGFDPRSRGWHTRQLSSYRYGDGNTRIREIYCPGCFEEYGWGD